MFLTDMFEWMLQFLQTESHPTIWPTLYYFIHSADKCFSKLPIFSTHAYIFLIGNYEIFVYTFSSGSEQKLSVYLVYNFSCSCIYKYTDLYIRPDSFKVELCFYIIIFERFSQGLLTLTVYCQ